MTTSQFKLNQKVISIINFIPEVSLVMYGNTSQRQIAELIKMYILKCPKSRDFFFQIYMGNIVDENGRQFSPDSLEYSRSWTVVYFFIHHIAATMKMTFLAENVFDSILQTSENNRDHLERQNLAINCRERGARSYIEECFRNAYKKYKKQQRKHTSIDDDENFYEGKHSQMHIEQDNQFFECMRTIETTYQFLQGYDFDNLLLPNVHYGDMMILEWMFDLENKVLGREWLQQKFTAVNQVQTIERLISFRRAVEHDNFEYIASEMDQVRRCKRNLYTKMLRDILSNIQELEDLYDDCTLKNMLQTLMKGVFDVDSIKERVNLISALKNVISVQDCIFDLVITRLERLLEANVHPEQMLLECHTMRDFVQLLIVVHKFQKRTAVHRNIHI